MHAQKLPLPTDKKLTAIEANEKALGLMTQMEEAFRGGHHGSNEKPFEMHLAELIPLLHSRLGGVTPGQRLYNPGQLVTRLLKLMSDPEFRNWNNDHSRYQLAAALHATLDLLVIESYEEKWIDLPKTLPTTHGDIEIKSVVENFRRDKASWARHYELDCCLENIKALLEKTKGWVKVLDIIKLGIQTDITGLLNYANELRQELQANWQVTVLLVRRITPLAQRSSKALAVLQTVMADHCRKTEFHCHYAAQEALHHIILTSDGEEREKIQRQAIGSAEADMKSAQQQPTLWHWARTYPPKRNKVANRILTAEDRCRYRLIHGIEHLLLNQMQAGPSSDFLLKAAIELLFYLNDSEPARLPESRAWIKKIIQTIESDKPKQFVLQQFNRENPDLEQKHFTLDQHRLKAEEKSLSLEHQHQQRLEQELRAAQEKLKQTHDQLAAEQKEWEAQKHALMEEKSVLEKRQKELSQSLKAEPASARQDLAQQQEAFTQREKDVTARGKSLDKRQQTLAQQARTVGRQAIQLKDQQTEFAQKEETFQLQKTDLEEREQLLILQLEEISLSKKPSQPVPIPAPVAISLILEWDEFKADSTQLKLFADFEKAGLELDAKNICGILRRPAYDCVKFQLGKGKLHGPYSDEGARQHIFKHKKNTCPCCQAPIQQVIEDFDRREDIQDKMKEKLDALNKQESSLISRPPLTASQNQHTLVPQSKTTLNATEFKLQDALITACENGDIKAVQTLLKQGAKANTTGKNELITACEIGDIRAAHALLKQGAKPDRVGKHPLGAAVYGMNPEVVNELLNEMKGVSPMTWEECESHNRMYYKNEVFIVPTFDPQTFLQWAELCRKMDLNPFLRTYHLNKANEMWHNIDTRTWKLLQCAIIDCAASWPWEKAWNSRPGPSRGTETGFASFRSQIKQTIEAAATHHKQDSMRVPESTAVPLIPTPEKKSTPPGLPQPPVSPAPISTAQNSQRFIPAPKTALSAAELKLQDELVTACENGDIKAVQALLKQGGKSNRANTTGKQPLSAAVYGMNPEVVQELLNEMKGTSPMTWEECEAHNKKYYQDEIFIVKEFAPFGFPQWYELLEKMTPNLFLSTYHLNKVEDAR